jgi:hypothetical protein
VGDIGLKLTARGPDILAVVGNILGNNGNGDDVVTRTIEENQRDRTRGSWIPGYSIGQTSRDLLVKTRRENGITSRGLRVVGVGVGSSKRHEGRDKTSCDEMHFRFICVL